MNIRFCALLPLLITAPISALAVSKSVLLLASAYEGKPAISITVPAEFMVFRFSIRSYAEKLNDQLREVQSTRATLVEIANKNSWRLHIGSPVVLTESYRKFSSFRDAGGELDAQADLILLAPVNEQTDLFALIRRVRQVAEKLTEPKKITVTTSGNWLGVEDPEHFRSDLLKRVRLHIDSTVEALGGRVELEISGLDESIMAQQVDEKQLELSLPLRVTYKRQTEAAK